jgi:Phosphoenolpyruvate phosphomutase
MTDQQKRARLREILRDGEGAIAPGVTDALFARLVQDCGFPAAHLSGNAIHKNFCLPDRNLLTITQIAQRVGQISEASDIPLIVDSGPICIAPAALARTVKSYERAGGGSRHRAAPCSRRSDQGRGRRANRLITPSDCALRLPPERISRSGPRTSSSIRRSRRRCDRRAACQSSRLPSHWRPRTGTISQFMAQGAHECV